MEFEGLTPRQLECARLVGRGLTDRQIAREIGVALPTVRWHLQAARERIGAPNRAALAVRVMRDED